jgi:basic membrane protein A and related proteins
VTLGSVVIDLPRAFLLVAKEVKGGTFRPRVVSFGMADQVVTWVENPALRERIPAAARAAADSVARLIRAGTFRPPGVWDGTRRDSAATPPPAPAGGAP